MESVMLKCGHIAMAVNTKDNSPYCPICDCSEVVEFKIEEGRKAACSYCGHITDSKDSLPFFEYRPNKDTDSYYCGCFGWD